MIRSATNKMFHHPMAGWSPPDMPGIKTKFAVGYVRLSDRGAIGTEVSLDRQRDEIKAWCDRNGLTLVATMEDVGVSGRKATRNGLDQAIMECSMRGALLVAYSLDRIARSPKVLDRLKSERVAFRAMDFPEVSELMLDVLMFVNSMYSRMVSSKMKGYHQNRKERAARGEVAPHPIPKGSPDRVKARQNIGAARQVHVDKSTARNRHVWTKVEPLHKSGKSTRQIAMALNDDGFVTSRNKPWSHVAVSRIIDQYCPVTVA